MMKKALIFMCFNLYVLSLSASPIETQEIVKEFSGVITNATGEYAVHEGKPCYIQVQEQSEDKIQYIFQITDRENQSYLIYKRVMARKHGVPVLLDRIIYDYSVQENARGLCRDSWNHEQLSNCEIQTQDLLNIQSQNENSYVQVKMKSILGVAISTTEMHCRLSRVQK